MTLRHGNSRYEIRDVQYVSSKVIYIGHKEDNEVSLKDKNAKMSSLVEMSETELNQIYSFAIQLAKDAGNLLIEALHSRRQDIDSREDLTEKLNAVDIVTKTDTEVEQFIHASISQRYPDHDFVGEESYSQGSTKDYLVTDRPTWIVDPLDGTVNFTHAFPMFCVSIALVVRQKPVIGVICAPMLNQLFSACQSKGAWLNERTRLPLLGQSIGPLPKNAPGKCIFSCEWGKDRRDSPEGNLHRKVNTFVNMASEPNGRGGKGGMVHGVRSLGSATLDLAYIAMGSCDLWWEGGCWEWDVAAGICLVEEAGGLITTANPPNDWRTCTIEPAKLGGRLYLAVRPAFDGPEETARQSQERAIREVWKRANKLDYSRPGVV
ncbi:hypothetical protein LTR64_006868 [Lithohypha guttulata]|uniref:uncharacterized protein n=1 Tax=Lithohypha guttulata TaxID=1690604 RepID=UPI002DE1ADA8|nr:hypothetical protein LTR51_004574 [Lithohypha guttulata]